MHRFNCPKRVQGGSRARFQQEVFVLGNFMIMLTAESLMDSEIVPGDENTTNGQYSGVTKVYIAVYHQAVF